MEKFVLKIFEYDLFPTKTGRNDFRVIHHDQISRMKDFWEIFYLMIDDLTILAIEHQQPRLVSRMIRVLRNQRWIKRKIKIGKIHCQPRKEILRVDLKESD